MDTNEWISTSEGAELTGYDKEYIRRLARAGDVTSKKIGWAMLISKSSLMDYYKKQEARRR